MSKRMLYVSRSNLADAPFPELTLPALARDGWEMTVVGVNATKSMYRKHLPFACEAIDLPRGALAHEAAVAKHLWKGRLGYDVIYVNSQTAALRGAVHLTGPKLGKKVVYHNPDYYSPLDYPWRFRLERRMCRKADLYINNEFHRGYITQMMYGRTGPVITAPPNLPRAWPVAEPSAERRARLTGGRSDAFVLMLHGSYGPLRMVPELFEALAMLPERFCLAMTGGEKNGDKVSQEIARLKLTGRVIRLGFLAFDEMLSYTVDADAGVLLYRNNDLGNFFTAPGRLTEYLSRGKPVLGSIHTGIENLIWRYQIGETGDATRPAELAAAIEKLAADAAGGRYTRERMRQVFEDHLAFDLWEPVVVEAMNRMLEPGKKPVQLSPPFPWLPKP